MMVGRNMTADFEMKSQDNIALQIYGHRKVSQITQLLFCCWLWYNMVTERVEYF
jgi:hypothetical protein